MKDYLQSLFIEQTGIQAAVVIFLIVAVGTLLGRIKVKGLSLGVTFVFFCGILAGHLGLAIDPRMLLFAQNFGLVIFVYALGLQVGPGFFNAFRKGGTELNLWGMAVIGLDVAMALGLASLFKVDIADMVGIMCGSVTNTPALAAEQQALAQMDLPSASPALACAITYPLGVLGVILAITLMRSIYSGRIARMSKQPEHQDNTFIAVFDVCNPAIFGRSLKDVARMSSRPFVVSRMWSGGSVTIPDSNTLLQNGDRLLIVTNKEAVDDLVVLFGCREQKDWNASGIDWNGLDSSLVSRKILVTRASVNGKSIDSLKLRNRFGVNISRVSRAGVMLLATPDLVLQAGDRLIVVGHASAVSEVETLLGNSVKELREPNVASISIGIIIGLALGCIPLYIPGISTPVKLGLAGGPVIAGILMGAFGPRIHMVTYTTESASLMLQRLGLAMYLACLGLDCGVHFFETVCRPEGLLWVALGFAITLIPVLIIGSIMLIWRKIDFPTICGSLCGCMANPMALTYSRDTLASSKPAVAYTTVYPFSMFLRVIIAQLIVLLCC